MPKEKAKGLQEYRQSRPEQLDFFELLLPEEKPYSNTIELYDFIRKYYLFHDLSYCKSKLYHA